MLVGYARISTTDQTLNLQHDALTKAGCSKIFTDTASGAKAEREGLVEAFSYVRAGDTIVVWKLDRLGRSPKDLIERITQLNDRKIGFRSITENIDTTTSGGKLIFHIFGALAEFERDIITRRSRVTPMTPWRISATSRSRTAKLLSPSSTIARPGSQRRACQATRRAQSVSVLCRSPRSWQ